MRVYIIRKNALSIFLEVKVRDLVAVQRRDAGRRRQNKRANFKSIGSLVLITCFFVRQNRFGALIQTFSQKTAKNQISGRFPPLPSTRYVLDILLFTSA